MIPAVLLVALAAAVPCSVPGDPARWYEQVCPKHDCPPPKTKDACDAAKYWKKKWCEGYIKGGGQTTPAECLEDRALIPAGVEAEITERDVKVDGKQCKQSVSYYAPGRHKEAAIACDGKRDGVYERWAETGKRYIQGGFITGAAAGVWSFYGPDDRLKFKMIYEKGHAVERAPPLAPEKDGAYELYLGDGANAARRFEADGKVTVVRDGKRAETYLDNDTFEAFQALLKKTWLLPALVAPCSGKEASLALRHAGEVRRISCAAIPAELLPLRAFLDGKVEAAGTLAGDVLAAVAAPADEPAGALDFPRGAKQ